LSRLFLVGTYGFYMLAQFLYFSVARQALVLGGKEEALAGLGDIELHVGRHWSNAAGRRGALFAVLDRLLINFLNFFKTEGIIKSRWGRAIAGRRKEKKISAVTV